MSLPTRSLIVILSAGLGVLLSVCLVLGVAFPWIQQSREAARLDQSKIHLRDQAFAAHAFHDRWRHLPPLRLDERSGPRHAWQTDLLPFIDREALHAAIDFTQSWDAAVNRDPFATRIPLYLHPGMELTTDDAGYALTHYAGNIQVMRPDGGLTLVDITDDDPTQGERGKSYTLLVGEIVAGSNAWGYPENLRDPALGLNRDATTFGSYSPRGVQFALVDGRVELFDPHTDPHVLRALADPIDGATNEDPANDPPQVGP
ncbi:MAG: DUF1559 domain-containing protein [Planctomycetaceae bacterium]